MKRAAVLDLGTNTFHLLIVERNGDQFRELVRKRIYVKLALDGIETLSEAAMNRGIDALHSLLAIVRQHQVHMIEAIGTAALRTASNANAYLTRIRREIGINVKIIDGDEEARLIYLGVAQIWNCPSKPALIMDIGGGSVEFIIADRTRYLWSASYPLGVALLYRSFHQEDPIPMAAQVALKDHIDQQIIELKNMLSCFPVSTLIGASGTFDVIGDLAGGLLGRKYMEVDIAYVRSIINEISKMDYAARAKDHRIPESRVDMIVVALLLLDKILSLAPFDKVGISTYALKEGVASELI